ncbi:MAG: tetratricopeptide repeat protein, partial [Gemmatimonadetes bacterium]
DLFGVASAVEAAQAIRPGVSVPELALPLARHYFANGEQGKSLPLYQAALAAAPDTVPEIVYEVAQAYDDVGDCRRALVHYERYRSMLRRWQRGEVNWKIGNCSLQLARELRDERAYEEALVHVDRMIELGEPRNLLAQAWFERGELLSALGRCDEAMEAFGRVREVSQAESNPLVERAQWRYDELRFVAPSGGVLVAGGC